jgi:hypothetical protein
MMSTASFSTSERLVLNAVARHASAAGSASAHQVRIDLLAAGLGKKDIGVTVASLVEKGVLARVKMIDADGLFYMAYRQVGPGV